MCIVTIFRDKEYVRKSTTHEEEICRLREENNHLKSELKKCQLECVSLQSDNFVDEMKKDEMFSQDTKPAVPLNYDPGMNMLVQDKPRLVRIGLNAGPLNTTLSQRPSEMQSTIAQLTTDVSLQSDNEPQTTVVEECYTASSQAHLAAKHHSGNNGTTSNGGGHHLDFQKPSLTGSGNCGPQDPKAGQDNDHEWLCRHYKRRCFVRFSCCKEYWPCHRCHNHQSKCGQKRLKSRDTKFIKCASCSKEQEFGKESKSCKHCHKTFAEFFCATCKHLTGMDDKPYHCQKCGICRIHNDRSFHCDLCGVCLDVQLRDNHKCRSGSAHDECCICLEDGFSGCQILPCSHKVHKECATRMIRSGITSCPICRASFAHKLEKRVQPSSQKQHGK